MCKLRPCSRAWSPKQVWRNEFNRDLQKSDYSDPVRPYGDARQLHKPDRRAGAGCYF
jgi:hypothetical protein